jgi:hypothetical protein
MWWLFQYEILFGDKKKSQDASVEPPAATSSIAPSGKAKSNSKRSAGSQQVAPFESSTDDGTTFGLSNDPDEYSPPAARGQKKRVHRSFQQMLKKDQLSYVPPSLPLYQHGVRGIHSRGALIDGD